MSDPDVLLVEVTPEHLPVLFEQQLDAEAGRMAAFPARDREAFLAHWAKILADASLVKRAILYEGRVAGHVGAFEREGMMLLGYWLGREFWGKGIATERSRPSSRWSQRGPSTRTSPSTTSARSGCWRSAASPSTTRRGSPTPTKRSTSWSWS